MKAVIEALADLVRVMPGATYVTVTRHNDGHCSIGIACDTDETAKAFADQLDMPAPTLIVATEHDRCWTQSCRSPLDGDNVSVTGPHRKLPVAVDLTAVTAAVDKAREAMAVQS